MYNCMYVYCIVYVHNTKWCFALFIIGFLKNDFSDAELSFRFRRFLQRKQYKFRSPPWHLPLRLLRSRTRIMPLSMSNVNYIKQRKFCQYRFHIRIMNTNSLLVCMLQIWRTPVVKMWIYTWKGTCTDFLTNL